MLDYLQTNSFTIIEGDVQEIGITYESEHNAIGTQLTKAASRSRADFSSSGLRNWRASMADCSVSKLRTCFAIRAIGHIADTAIRGSI